MKKNFIYSIFAVSAAIVFGQTLTGCSDEREALSGQGTLALSATINSDVKVNSRAATEAELADKAIVWISNSKGVVRKYNGLQNIPAEGVPLMSNSYVAEVWTGDSLSASFDTKYYKGREAFEITSNNVTRVDIKCTVANTVASVVYGEGVDELISNYKMTVGHKRGELVFEGRDDRKGYFMMPSYDKNLKWNLEGELANGTVYTRSGVIENAKPATEYIIHVNYNPDGGDTTEGGAYFDIVIDEKAIVVEDEVVISLAPQFKGYNFDIDEPLFGEVGKFDRHSVMVYGTSALNSLILETSLFNDIAGGSDVDLFNMSETVAAKMREVGINFTYTYDEASDLSEAKINFEAGFLNTLTEGQYPIVFTATDALGKTNSKTMTVMASDASVLANDANDVDIWATSATLTARVLKSDATNPAIAYRKAGQAGWTTISDVTIADNVVTAELSGLEASTTYEYIAVADGYESPTIKTFTTEAATQLPNSGFENWDTSSSPYLIYASGQEMFWDSGNHGSAKMSKNVTVPATDIKHSGQYSIKLESQFVGVGTIGKFAAGNVFIGKYLKTIGTNGVLGWGRPWTARPKALKGYLHYTPKTVEYGGDQISKGDMDRGIIYIAILDGTQTDFEGSQFPVIVNTSTKEFFDKDGAQVIGYGELIVTEATQGDAMVEFNIPINYVRNAKAVNIMLTASASQFGDYFLGGPSVMYLDDLQLVY